MRDCIKEKIGKHFILRSTLRVGYWNTDFGDTDPISRFRFNSMFFSTHSDSLIRINEAHDIIPDCMIALLFNELDYNMEARQINNTIRFFYIQFKENNPNYFNEQQQNLFDSRNKIIIDFDAFDQYFLEVPDDIVKGEAFKLLHRNKQELKNEYSKKLITDYSSYISLIKQRTITENQLEFEEKEIFNLLNKFLDKGNEVQSIIE